MRRLCTIVGALLMLSGAVWFFQGINVISGSFMTGQPRWAINGAIAFGVGAVLLIAAWLMARSGPRAR